MFRLHDYSTFLIELVKFALLTPCISIWENSFVALNHRERRSQEARNFKFEYVATEFVQSRLPFRGEGGECPRMNLKTARVPT